MVHQIPCRAALNNIEWNPEYNLLMYAGDDKKHPADEGLRIFHGIAEPCGDRYQRQLNYHMALMSNRDQVFIFAVILGAWWHCAASSESGSQDFYLTHCATNRLNSSSVPSPPNTTNFSNGTSWTNNDKLLPYRLHFTDSTIGRFLLLSSNQEGEVDSLDLSSFGLCFHCRLKNDDHSCRVAVLLLDVVTLGGWFVSYKEVWSANPKSPVGENATLELASDGNLVLKKAAGRPVWWSGTTGELISHMSISESGNWGLFDRASRALWQSFDHPTDTLLPGQGLHNKQHLNSENGLFYLNVDEYEISGYVNGRRPVKYFKFAPVQFSWTHPNLTDVEFSSRGKLTFVYSSHRYPFQFPVTSKQFFRLDGDGGVRIYGWEPLFGWKVIYVFGWDECQFPLKCGRYGICQSGQCTCPVGDDGTQYFKPLNPRLPGLGCEKTVGEYPQHQLVAFPGLTCLITGDNYVQMENEERCKEVCAANTSCNAAVFSPSDGKASRGACFLLDDVLSLVGASDETFLLQLYLKVQVSSPKKILMPHGRKQLRKTATLLIFLPASVMLGGLSFALVMTKRRRRSSDKIHVQGLSENPLRLSYHELRVATRNFSQILGEGGFGVVFKGVLKNGTVVAVKRLKEDGQGIDEFLAEMETLGTIHHISLVSLVGFCSDRNQSKMLVYEYMSGGSLDKWIFRNKTKSGLDWNTKKRILLDVARGLAYLHQECRQKIAHLDVKPQNILLDDKMNAKLSDFGLSKLINRDESEVVTHVRGTLGYLAPEWQNARITVKADTYSFGVVVLEVITGRKILDYSQEVEAHVHLPGLLQEKAAASRLMDVVDCYCVELALQSERDQAVAMIQLGMWCLNINYTKRPSMSLVVNYLEGVLASAPDLYPQAHLNISPSNILNCVSSHG